MRSMTTPARKNVPNAYSRAGSRSFFTNRHVFAGGHLHPAARAYLAQVASQLRDVDPRLRTKLITIAAENLAERPHAESFDELASELGGPRDYAQTLREEAESAEPGLIELSRARRRRRRWWAVGIVIALITAAAAVTAWWVTWQADIQANSLRVCDNAALPDEEYCSQSRITDIRFADMLDVDCHGVISISQNLTADRDITVTGASLTGVRQRTGPDEPTEPGVAPPLLLDEIQVWQNTDPEWAPKRLDWPVTISPYPTDTYVTFLVTTCPPSAKPHPGLSRFIESLQISYHALGRDRTMTIPLMTPIAITTR